MVGFEQILLKFRQLPGPFQRAPRHQERDGNLGVPMLSSVQAQRAGGDLW